MFNLSFTDYTQISILPDITNDLLIQLSDKTPNQTHQSVEDVLYNDNNTKSNNTTICLNMIVRNESKIITRLLNSVLPIIDCYCICDTGSTDNTIEVITDFFKTHNISGIIFSEPFKNFGYNRTVSLQKCYGLSDYVLLLDADMQLSISSTFDKSMLSSYEVIYICQGNLYTNYHCNIRIIKIILFYSWFNKHPKC
jgi:glycosyltransferase involved in cell wall biosynthesis